MFTSYVVIEINLKRLVKVFINNCITYFRLDTTLFLFLKFITLRLSACLKKMFRKLQTNIICVSDKPVGYSSLRVH